MDGLTYMLTEALCDKAGVDGDANPVIEQFRKNHPEITETQIQEARATWDTWALETEHDQQRVLTTVDFIADEETIKWLFGK